jgi:hypothetical protein
LRDRQRAPPLLLGRRGSPLLLGGVDTLSHAPELPGGCGAGLIGGDATVGSELGLDLSPGLGAPLNKVGLAPFARYTDAEASHPDIPDDGLTNGWRRQRVDRALGEFDLHSLSSRNLAADLVTEKSDFKWDWVYWDDMP